MLDSPEALKVKKVFTALGEKVKSEIGRKPMLRAIAADFLAHFMDAGRAGLRSYSFSPASSLPPLRVAGLTS